MRKYIGIHEPFFSGKETKYLAKCIKDGWVSTSGSFLELFCKKICKITKSKYALPVLNGTIGLHLSLLLSKIKRNDEVLVPTITFIASVNAIRYLGALPIFMDTDEYLNLDQSKTIEFIKKRTRKVGNFSINTKTKRKVKAVIIVHTFGNAANFEKLKKLCKLRNIKIIEDAAESLGTYYKKGKLKKKHTGTIGDFGVISFNGNKIITAGNGGVLLTQNKRDYFKGKYLISQSKNDRINFLHHELGYNYKLSNISAALGLAQLENLDFYLKKKEKVRKNYIKFLKKCNYLKILESPDYSKNNNWLNLIKIKKKKFNKHNFIKKLQDANIQVRPIWHPNHLQKHLKNFEKYRINKSIKLIDNIVCLPSSSFLKMNQIKKITETIKKTLK